MESGEKKRERIGIYGIRMWWKKIKRKKNERKKRNVWMIERNKRKIILKK